MPGKVDIRRLTKPTTHELDQIGSILLEAFIDDPISRASCSGDEQLMYAMHRSVAAGAAVGAHLYVALDSETQNIVGTAAFYGPGVEICGDEIQRSQGFDEFLQTLHAPGQEWLGSFLPKYAAVTDAVIGPGVKKNSWALNNLAVAAPYRGRGIGRALVEAGEALASRDKLPLIFEAEGEHNTGIYKRFGFQVIGEQALKGGNGVGDFSITIVRKDFV